VVMEILIESCS